ncbi:hypothetical protein ACLOJK_010297 [Asimina triloba]
MWYTCGAPIRCSTINLEGGSHGCHRRSTTPAASATVNDIAATRRLRHHPSPQQPPSLAALITAPRHDSRCPLPSLSPLKLTNGECPICRGRKPTTNTAGTRGKFASSVVDKCAFIPLRSSPISNLNHTIFQSEFLWAKLADLIQSSIITDAGPERFLLSLIQPSFLSKPIYHRLRHRQGLNRSIWAVHRLCRCRPTSLSPPAPTAAVNTLCHHRLRLRLCPPSSSAPSPLPVPPDATPSTVVSTRCIVHPTTTIIRSKSAASSATTAVVCIDGAVIAIVAVAATVPGYFL